MTGVPVIVFSCYVAKGIFDIYYESGIHIWDVAAGVIIIKEAGGEVVNFNGKIPINIIVLMKTYRR